MSTFLSEVGYWEQRIDRPPPGIDKDEYIKKVHRLRKVAGYFHGNFSVDLHPGFSFIDYRRFIKGIPIYGYESPFAQIDGIKNMPAPPWIFKRTVHDIYHQSHRDAATDLFMRVNAALSIAQELAELRTKEEDSPSVS